MQWACPQCGSVLKRGDPFCRRCGCAIAIPPALEAQWNAPRTEPSRIVGWVLAIVLIGGLVLAGVLGVSRAYRNAQSQLGFVAGSEDYNKAAALYQAGNYRDAAAAFQRLRQSRSATDETNKKAAQGEVYCYRELGHQAQNRDAFAEALQWYDRALSVLPDDQAARTERDAVAKVIGAGAPAPPSNTTPPPDRTTEFPKQAAPGTPNVSAADFQKANEKAAQEAQQLLQQGDQLQQSGDLKAALDTWTKAAARSPGSSASATAQQRLITYAQQHNPFDGM